MKKLFIFLIHIVAFMLAIQLNAQAVYQFSDLPSVFYVKQGEKIEFRIEPEPDIQISMEEAPAYSSISFDVSSQVFLYESDFNHYNIFSVTFKKQEGGKEEFKTIRISPQPNLISEFSVLNLPDNNYQINPYDKQFYSVTEYPGQKTTLNYVDRATRVVEVAGHTLIFAPGSALYDSYSGSEDIETFKIYADSLIIRGTLDLPGTNLEIYARVISFVDGLETASINTTARSLEYPADPAGPDDSKGADGLDGLPPGDMQIYAGKILQNSPNIRYIGKGGNGQEGGEGRHGAPGRSMRALSTAETGYKFPSSRIHNGETHYLVWGYYKKERKLKDDRIFRYGAPRFTKPEDGEDGIFSGKSGSATNSANITSNLNLETLIDVSPGSTIISKDYQGGKAGEPKYSMGANKGKARSSQIDFYFYVSEDGQDAPAPLPDRIIGETGKLEINNQDPYIYLSPIYLQSVISYAEDLYLNDNMELAYQELTKVESLLKEYQAHPAFQNLEVMKQAEFEFIDNHVAGLKGRMEEGLTYFGTAYNWSPYLSFEANYLLYEQHVERAIHILYLVELLENANVSLENKKAALEELKTQTLLKSEELIEEMKILQSTIPQQTIELKNFGIEVEKLQIELKHLENILLDKARAKAKKASRIAKIQTGAKILGTVTTFIPGGQPFATAFNIVGNLNLNEPVSFDNLGVVLDGIDNHQKEYDASLVKTLEKSESLLDYIGSTNPLDYLDKVPRDSLKKLITPVKSNAKPLIEAGKSIKKDIDKFRKLKPDVQGQLDALKASNPEYKALVQKVKDAQAKYSNLDAEIRKTQNDLLQQNFELNENFLSLDASYQALGKANFVLDANLISYVKVMKRNSLYRLTLYNFLLAKSYEYRLLEEYDKGINLNPVFEKMKELIEVSSGKTILSKEEFLSLKALYQAQLSDITHEIIEKANFNRRQSSVFLRVSEEQRKSLSEGKTIAINPVSSVAGFLTNREDLRVLDVKVHHVDAQNPGQNSGPYLNQYFLDIEHSGESLLRKGDDVYLFQNINPLDPRPHRWTSFWLNQGEVQQESPSPANESLLSTLLGSTDAEKLLYFSQPGLESDFLVELHSNVGVLPKLDSLVIEFIYDYDYSYNFSKSNISVKSTIGAGYFKTSLEDKNGRKDGIGQFNRVYSRSWSDVSFTAQKEVGEYVFQGWYNNQGFQIDEQASFSDDSLMITIPLINSRELVAKYELRDAQLNLSEDTLVIPWEGGTFAIDLINQGKNSELEWQINDIPSSILPDAENGILDKSEQREFNILFEERIEDTEIIEYLVFNHVNDLDDDDTLVIIREKVDVVIPTPKGFPMTLYPNPIQNNITIRIDNIDYINRIQIISLGGTLKKEFIINEPQIQEVTIDLGELNSGIYIITVHSESGKISTEKIIKE